MNNDNPLVLEVTAHVPECDLWINDVLILSGGRLAHIRKVGGVKKKGYLDVADPERFLTRHSRAIGFRGFGNSLAPPLEVVTSERTYRTPSGRPLQLMK